MSNISVANLTAALADEPLLFNADGGQTVTLGPDPARAVAEVAVPHIHERFLDRRTIVERLIDGDHPVFGDGSEPLTLKEALATLAAIERWDAIRRNTLDAVGREETIDAGDLGSHADRLLELTAAGVVVRITRDGKTIANIVPA